MRVFISWSGDVSHAVASNIKSFLESVLPGVESFVSNKDIPKGSLWLTSILDALDSSQFGIVCVVPGNRTSAWLAFETGVLFHALNRTRVSPLVLGLPPEMLPGPLAQLQATRFDRSDVLALLQRLRALVATPPSQADFTRSFDEHWPRLEAHLKALERVATAADVAGAAGSPSPTTTRGPPKLSLEHIEVLLAIEKSDDRALLPAFVANLLGLSVTRAEVLLDDLQQADLVKPFEDPDGYVWFVLTPSGKRLLVEKKKV